MNHLSRIAAALVVLLAASTASAAVVIDDYTFDLGQFANAAVTYRTKAQGGTVTFAGKQWDQVAGVDNYTTGELAADQYGSDPGDQLSLNNRTTPDWFQLTYAGAGLTVSALNNMFVVYEITSSDSGVDLEGTSWRISFNGGAFINASAATQIKFLDLPSPAENVNEIAFNLLNFGLNPGDLLKTVRVENIDSGSETSDPDFIFTALGSAAPVVPEPASLVVWSLLALCAGGAGWWRRRKQTA